MKKIIAFAILAMLGTKHADAQVLEIIQLVTTKVIKAIDLNIQRMQNEVMALQNLAHEAENQLSKDKLAEIGEWELKQKELYANYYASLKQVKTCIAQGPQTQTVLRQQTAFTDQLNVSITQAQTNAYLSLSERSTILGIYNAINTQSKEVVTHLQLVLQNNKVQATDAERMQLVAKATNELQMLTQQFSSISASVSGLITQRMKSAQENSSVRNLYGLK